jgi:hypothetical protein
MYDYYLSILSFISFIPLIYLPFHFILLTFFIIQEVSVENQEIREPIHSSLPFLQDGILEKISFTLDSITETILIYEEIPSIYLCLFHNI